MDWLFIPGMGDANENQNEVKYISEMILKFLQSNPDISQYIKEFPEEDGVPPASKKDDALFTIIREFFIWLKKQPERQDMSFSLKK